jgi:hypothetical protein
MFWDDINMGEMEEMGEMNMEEMEDMLMDFFEEFADDLDSLTVADVKEKLKDKKNWKEKEDMLFDDLLDFKNGGFEEMW